MPEVAAYLAFNSPTVLPQFWAAGVVAVEKPLLNAPFSIKN
jgi:hypothetical protein